MALSFTTWAKDEYMQTPVFIFGHAMSPTDSTIYVTNIQRIDTAYVQKKKGFLMTRANYSQQLQMLMEQRYGLNDAICTTFFDLDSEKLIKKYNKLVARIKENKEYKLQLLDERVIQYRVEQWDETDYVKPERAAEPTKEKPKKKKK